MIELVIKNNEGYELAANVLKEKKGQLRTILVKEKELLDPINKAHKTIKDFFRLPIQHLKDIESIIKKSMSDYNASLEAAKRAEEERLRIAAEKQRKYEEKLAKKRAETALKKGNEEKADEIMQEIESVPVVAPVLADPTPHVAGVKIRETWHAEVTDKMELIKAVAAGHAPETLLDVNSKTLGQMARSMKSYLKIAGIIVFSKKGIAV